LALERDEYGVEVVPEDERWIKRSGGALVGGSLLLIFFVALMAIASYYTPLDLLRPQTLLLPAVLSGVIALALSITVMRYTSKSISKTKQYNKYKLRYKPIFDQMPGNPSRVVLEKNSAKAFFDDMPEVTFNYYFGVIRSEKKVSGGEQKFAVSAGYAVSAKTRIKEKWKGEVTYSPEKDFGRRFNYSGDEVKSVWGRLAADKGIDKRLEGLGLMSYPVQSAVRFDYGHMEIDLYLKASVTPGELAEATKVIREIYANLAGKQLKD